MTVTGCEVDRTYISEGAYIQEKPANLPKQKLHQFTSKNLFLATHDGVYTPKKLTWNLKNHPKISKSGKIIWNKKIFFDFGFQKYECSLLGIHITMWFSTARGCSLATHQKTWASPTPTGQPLACKASWQRPHFWDGYYPTLKFNWHSPWKVTQNPIGKRRIVFQPFFQGRTVKTSGGVMVGTSYSFFGLRSCRNSSDSHFWML